MKKIKNFALLIILSIIIGGICGLCGTAFSKAVEFVTNVRGEHSWLLYLLPLGGLLSVIIFKLCRSQNAGTTSVFDCVKTKQNLPPLLAVAIFCGTCLSHLFGASAGREGAALQIGGGVSNVFSRLFKLNEDTRHKLIMCGMAALFSAVFGTPLAAAFFAIEVILSSVCISAAIPVFLSSAAGYAVAMLLHVHPERFNIGALPQFSFSVVWKIAVITIAGVLVAFVLCAGLETGKTVAKKLFKNEYLRIAIGGAVIIGLTLLVGNYDYNGGGINIIEGVFEGNVSYEAFALKLLFTVICVACGYKGGEIIPTLFIGATLGGTLAVVLGLSIGTGAAVGMAVLFVCATKCPIATIFLCLEMFGFGCALVIIPVVIVSFCLARYKGLYKNVYDVIYLIKERKNKSLG
ncbi:MAG: chloride channel protein [Clostridia bacterium]|nr:chloride channel protein [Clostridia bacterium]